MRNIQKGLSYSFGFDRMNDSIQKGFYLEAIMMAESIISDRLLSYVTGNTKKNPSIRSSFHDLIIDWQDIDGEVPWKERTDLISDVMTWKNERNKCAHSVAKSLPGTETIKVEEFQRISENCAKAGKILAQDICSWHKKEYRKYKTLNEA